MPEFNYDGYVDIDPSDYVDACSDSEIEDLIECLIDYDYLKNTTKKVDEQESVMEWEFNQIIEKITSNYIRLTSEEEEMLRKIASRF